MLLLHFLLIPKRKAKGFKRRAIILYLIMEKNLPIQNKNQKKLITIKTLRKKGIKITNTFNLTVVTKKNNIFLVLTDLNGRIIQHTTSGLNGFKNSNKSRPAAFESTIITFFQTLIRLSITKVILIFKGVSSIRNKVIQTLKLDIFKDKLNIKGLVIIDSNPHNGCRLQKTKRR